MSLGTLVTTQLPSPSFDFYLILWDTMGETILPASLHEYLDLIFMETASTLFNSDWTFADHQQPSTCQSSTQTEAPPDRDFSDISHTHQAVNAKIPIVRNPHPKIYTSSSRVGQACGNCREQKAKCSGHRPTCNRCQISGAHCSYGERKGIMMLKCV
jgi:hypothetical protein